MNMMLFGKIYIHVVVLQNNMNNNAIKIFGVDFISITMIEPDDFASMKMEPY